MLVGSYPKQGGAVAWELTWALIKTTSELSLCSLRKVLMADVHHGNRYFSCTDHANVPYPS